MPDVKPCTGCGEVKPLGEYNRNRNRPDGRQSRCRECAAEYKRRYYEKNRDKKLERDRRYREENRDKVLERHRRYREENRDKVAEVKRRWREKNLDKVLERDRRYREENRDKVQERTRRYYEENREFCNRSAAHYRKKTQDNTALTATRAGKPWTPAEDDILTADDGRDLFAKALLLGRTYASCRSRRAKLNRAAA